MITSLLIFVCLLLPWLSDSQQVPVESQLPLTTLTATDSCLALTQISQGGTCEERVQQVCNQYHLTEDEDADLMGAFDRRSMAGLTGTYYLAPYATSIIPSPLNSQAICTTPSSSEGNSSTFASAACICQTSGIVIETSSMTAPKQQAIISTAFTLNSSLAPSSAGPSSSCELTLPFDEMFESISQCQRTTGRCPTEDTCNFFEEVRRWDGDADKVDGLEGFTDEEKRHYLEFAQGCYRLPQCDVVSSAAINTKKFKLSCPLCGSLGSMQRVIEFTLKLDGTAVQSVECSKKVEIAAAGSQFLGLSATTSSACLASGSAAVADPSSASITNCGDHGCCMKKPGVEGQPDQSYCQCYEDAIRGYWQGEGCNECRTEYHASSTVPCRNRKSDAQIAFEQLASESALPMILPFILFLAAFIVFSTCRQRWASDKEYHFRKTNDRLVRPDSANATAVRDPNDIIFKSKVIPKRPAGSRGLVSRRQRLWGRPNHQGPEIHITREAPQREGPNTGTTTTTTAGGGGGLPPAASGRGGGGAVGARPTPVGHTRNNSSTNFSGVGLESSMNFTGGPNFTVPSHSKAAPAGQPGPSNHRDRNTMPYSPAATPPPSASAFAHPSTRPNSVAPVAGPSSGGRGGGAAHHERQGSILPTDAPGTSRGEGEQQDDVREAAGTAGELPPREYVRDPFDIEEDEGTGGLDTGHRRRTFNHPPPLDMSSTTQQQQQQSQPFSHQQTQPYTRDEDESFRFE